MDTREHVRFLKEYNARQQIWHLDAAPSRTRGHIDDYRADGEPELLRDDRDYRTVPLILPADRTDIRGIQRRWANCHLISGLNALEKKAPGTILGAVRQVGDKVVVRTHRGTYTMNATLPFNPDGTAAFATMPGGSTAVAFIEKAAAMHFGSYRSVQYGNAADAMHWVAGDRYPTTHIQDIREMSLDEVRSVLQSDSPAAVNIVPPERPFDIPPDLARYNLNPKHVFVPDQLDSDGGLVLRNPLVGTTDSTGLTLEALHGMNASLHWVS
ncbi:MAG: hypothetical protein HOQ36_17655 [Nocardia sp.]|nr:hypothetical protein [Nocardia sp.]